MFENLPKLNGTATVEFIINDSSIIIEVFGNHAPITGGNFVDLVERGVYDGLAFHRVIREPSPFVVQGGDPQGADPNFPIESLGTGGFIDPETGLRRTIPLEIKLEGDEEPTYNTVLGRLAGNPPPDVVLENDRGAIAMARSSAPNSASSQFYFALDELAFLDGDYAVFGEIVEGLDVLDDIERGDRIEDAEVIEGLENLVPGINIVLGGFENDFLVGSNGNDRITGGDGDDTLIGVNLNSPESNLGKGERDILVGDRKFDSTGNDTFILGDANNVFYNDGDSLTRGEADLARILGFNSTDDTIQLHGSADLYSLKFGSSVEGRTDARIVYQPENATVGEIIAKIIDVNTDLTLDDSAFVFL